MDIGNEIDNEISNDLNELLSLINECNLTYFELDVKYKEEKDSGKKKMWYIRKGLANLQSLFFLQIMSEITSYEDFGY